MRLLERQRSLQREHFGTDPLFLKGEDRAEYIRYNTLAATDELHEALRESVWKPWHSHRVEYGTIKRAKYVEELVDAMHHLGNLFLAAGVTDEELEELYEAKRQVNVERREAVA